jgi:hypothetical protein
MFDRHQFRDLVVRTLTEMGIPSRSATELLLGTCAQESQMGTYLRQINMPLGAGGLGCMQMERTTFEWLWQKYYQRFPVLIGIEFEQLEYDLRASIIMARLRYMADPKPLPMATDMVGLAMAWKRVYNTEAGKGTTAEFISNYHEYCM